MTTMSSINTTLQTDMDDATMDRILFNVQAVSKINLEYNVYYIIYFIRPYNSFEHISISLADIIKNLF